MGKTRYFKHRKYPSLWINKKVEAIKIQFVWIFFHMCWTYRKLAFWIPQGSVATCQRWGGYCRMGLYQISYAFQQCKTFRNWLTFDKVTESLNVGTFFETQCTWQTSVARRPWPGVLQAGSDSSSVSERPRTTVPLRLLRPGRQCWHLVASAFRKPSTTCSTSLPAQHLRPSGLFSCQPHCLELSSGTRPSVETVSEFRTLLKTYLFAQY